MFFASNFQENSALNFRRFLHRNATRNFMFFAILQKNVKLENHQFYIQITYFSGMAHFATTALIRKRTVEKRSENHSEKTSKIHGKSNENSLRFVHPFWSPFFMDFHLIFRLFFNLN